MTTYRTLPITPQFVLQEDPDPQVHRVEFNTGDAQEWPAYHGTIRGWLLQWAVGTWDETEQLKAFLRYHNGATTPFEWELQSNNPIPRPYKAPEVTLKAGGSTGARTIYVAYTLSDGTNETPRSYRYATLTLAAGSTIVVRSQPFPESITQANVYVGTSSSDLKLQTPAITDHRIGWTEPPTGYATGGANPPSTNAVTETVLVYAIEDTLEANKATSRTWQLSVKVKEKIAA